MKMLMRWLGVAALVVAMGAVGCGRGKTGPTAAPSGAIHLNGAGATFPYPLYSRWISDYHAVDSRVQISYESIGSGGGIQRLQTRTVDFGASDAPLSDKEEKAMPAPVLHIPTVAGAVVVAYNLSGLREQLRLDGPTIAGIFLGEITRWDDPKLAALNPGAKLPATRIFVVHRSDGSGTTYLFTSYLSAISPDWKSRVGAGKSVNWPAGVGAKGNEGVTGGVKQTSGAIGYVELAYAQQNHLLFAQVRNAAGKFINPDVPSTAAAAAGAANAMKQDVRVSIVNSPVPDAYPIAGFTYLLVYQDQPDRTEGGALARFLLWGIEQGQQAAEPLGYVPLPSAVVDIDRQAIGSMTSGGKPLMTGSTP